MPCVGEFSRFAVSDADIGISIIRMADRAGQRIENNVTRRVYVVIESHAQDLASCSLKCCVIDVGVDPLHENRLTHGGSHRGVDRHRRAVSSAQVESWNTRVARKSRTAPGRVLHMDGVKRSTRRVIRTECERDEAAGVRWVDELRKDLLEVEIGREAPGGPIENVEVPIGVADEETERR